MAISLIVTILENLNGFLKTDKEVIKIIDDYKPLILKVSTLNNGIDEDLKQEIELEIFRALTKNRKN